MRLWRLLLPGLLALAAACYLGFNYWFGVVMASWDVVDPSRRWFLAGGIGQAVLAMGALVTLLAGASRPGWRGAAVAEWVILAAECGWFALICLLARNASARR